MIVYQPTTTSKLNILQRRLRRRQRTPNERVRKGYITSDIVRASKPPFPLQYVVGYPKDHRSHPTTVDADDLQIDFLKPTQASAGYHEGSSMRPKLQR